MTVEVAGVSVQLYHARGETNDHTWVFFPDSSILCTGDLFIWGVPNAGNPQKVQRYAKEWADALRKMMEFNPKILCPGHGVPIIGKDRVKDALTNTAKLLESLHTQTIKLMNSDASMNTIIHNVKVPDELLQKPYLKPIYDEPEFIVRNIWRLYGGWYDGTPSHLKPAPEIDQAMEISRLAGGAKNLVMRGLKLSNTGNHRMACHLAEWAYLSSPDDNEVCEIAGKIFTARAKVEKSTMAIGIFLAAARNMGGKPEEEMPGNSVIRAQSLRGKK
jgi:alkyl sulfatase BDS1-like metallo-beta-lactamase superfamily hydrolase